MRERLDKLLVDRGLASTREKARALIMEGKVSVHGVKVTKAGTFVSPDAAVDLRGEEIPYVSRGGVKLEAALKSFGVRVEGKRAMDVGSSTGGFTDCLLQHGAAKIYCIDVGYGQLAWKLRNDPRVTLLERTNIRYLDRERIPELIDIATIDVSFISLVKVVPKVLEFLREGGEIVALIKPQFEVGRGQVGKGGIVRDEDTRLSAVESIRRAMESLGLETRGVIESPLPGQKGNREYLMYVKKGQAGQS
jgi:23S rRNA (cytidine1920-2'-O)/16S rRNA (cytidine1409-2'-O)-methyltransferase